VATQQFFVVEEALKVAWKSVVSSYVQQNLKESEGLLCQKFDNIEVNGFNLMQ
jgi:hypothetical protein